jgi:hypothetical protein
MDRATAKLGGTTNILYIYIYIYIQKPKRGRPAGLTPGPPPHTNALTYHAQTNRPTAHIVTNAQKNYLNVDPPSHWGRRVWYDHFGHAFRCKYSH